MPKPGSQPAKRLVIRLVKAMLIFARHRLRNRIIRTPEAAMTMIRMAPMFTCSKVPRLPPESNALAAVPRWRAVCRVRGHKLVSHTEQVPQDNWCDVGQANQHGCVVQIVVGHVVNARSGCEQFGAVVEADANHKRTRLSRTMRDRKSTRLNSSHTVISYAVFCLKKKKR